MIVWNSRISFSLLDKRIVRKLIIRKFYLFYDNETCVNLRTKEQRFCQYELVAYLFILFSRKLH
jgi:hypothetical protein